MCQKLCKLAGSRQSYSKNKKGAHFLKHSVDIPPHLTYVATLPCETRMTENQRFVGFSVIRVSQGSVATYVRCGGMSTYHLYQISC